MNKKILSVKGYVKNNTLITDIKKFKLKTPGFNPEEGKEAYCLLAPNNDNETWRIIKFILT